MPDFEPPAEPRVAVVQDRVGMERTIRIAVATLVVCAGLAASAQAETSTSTSTTIAPSPQTFATITPTLSPDRLGAHGALTLTIHFTGGALGVPTPVRRAVLRLPAGLTLEIPSLRSCSAARLEARGARGCPRQSKIGTGRALVEAYLGAQPIAETATLWAFLGPLNNLQPTFEVLGQGYSPIGEQMVLTAAALPDRPPYGEQLVMSIPPIPTVPPEPDASISSFSLTIGTDSPHRPRDANTVLIPSSCPAGGFPFAAEFTYADGSQRQSVSRDHMQSPRGSAVRSRGASAAAQRRRRGAPARPWRRDGLAERDRASASHEQTQLHAQRAGLRRRARLRARSTCI